MSAAALSRILLVALVILAALAWFATRPGALEPAALSARPADVAMSRPRRAVGGDPVSGEVAMDAIWDDVAEEPAPDVEPSLVDVRILVLDPSGAPAPDVVVTINPRGRRDRSHPRVVTDGAGRATARLEIAEGVLLMVHRAGISVTALVTPSGGAEQDVVLRLPGRFAITGVLRTPDGAPLARGDVEVEAHTAVLESRNETAIYGVITGPDGRFEVALPRPGRYGVIGATERWSSAGPVRVELTEENARVEVELRLREPVDLRGTVRWDDGSPAAGALLMAFVPPPEGELATSAHRLLWGGARAEARSDGSFVLLRLNPEGRYAIRVRVPGAAEAVDVALESDVAPETGPLTLVIRRQAALRGTLAVRVVGPTGDAVTSFQCRLERESEAADEPWQIEATERVEHPEGRLELTGLVPDVRYRLTVRAASDAPGRHEWVMPRGDAAVTVELRERGSLAVSVVSTSGRSTVGLPLQVVGLFDLSETEHSRVFGRVQRQTDEAGQWLESGLVPGPYEVRVGDDETAPRERFEVFPGRRTSVRLRIP